MTPSILFKCWKPYLQTHGCPLAGTSRHACEINVHHQYCSNVGGHIYNVGAKYFEILFITFSFACLQYVLRTYVDSHMMLYHRFTGIDFGLGQSGHWIIHPQSAIVNPLSGCSSCIDPRQPFASHICALSSINFAISHSKVFFSYLSLNFLTQITSASFFLHSKLSDLCIKGKFCQKEIFTHVTCKIHVLANETIAECTFYQ